MWDGRTRGHLSETGRVPTPCPDRRTRPPRRRGRRARRARPRGLPRGGRRVGAARGAVGRRLPGHPRPRDPDPAHQRAQVRRAAGRERPRPRVRPDRVRRGGGDCVHGAGAGTVPAAGVHQVTNGDDRALGADEPLHGAPLRLRRRGAPGLPRRRTCGDRMALFRGPDDTPFDEDEVDLPGLAVAALRARRPRRACSPGWPTPARRSSPSRPGRGDRRRGRPGRADQPGRRAADRRARPSATPPATRSARSRPWSARPVGTPAARPTSCHAAGCAPQSGAWLVLHAVAR